MRKDKNMLRIMRMRKDEKYALHHRWLASPF